MMATTAISKDRFLRQQDLVPTERGTGSPSRKPIAASTNSHAIGQSSIVQSPIGQSPIGQSSIGQSSIGQTPIRTAY